MTLSWLFWVFFSEIPEDISFTNPESPRTKVGNESGIIPQLCPKVGNQSDIIPQLCPKMGNQSDIIPQLCPKVGNQSDIIPQLCPKVGNDTPFITHFTKGKPDTTKKTPLLRSVLVDFYSVGQTVN